MRKAWGMTLDVEKDRLHKLAFNGISGSLKGAGRAALEKREGV